MSDFKKFTEIPASTIEEWKAKYPGSISMLEVEIDEYDDSITTEPQIATFILKKPSRHVMNLVGELGAKKEITKANNALISNCVLGGDMDVLESDGAVYSEVIASIERMMGAKKRSLKKL